MQESSPTTSIPSSAGGTTIVDTPAAMASPQQQWPSRGAAWYALIVLVVATGLNFLGLSVFSMLVERIKIDLVLTDEQLGWLIGPATVLFYVVIGIPLARLVDIYPRKTILAGGLFFTSGMTAFGGIAQGFGQLFGTRMMVGVGSSAHGPGCYSLLADFFPPNKLPRAIAVFQLGYISGTTLGVFVGGYLLAMTASWGVTQFAGMTIHSWQWVLLMVAAPGILVSLALLLIHEPPRRGLVAKGKPMPLRQVGAEVWSRRAAYFPLFSGVVFSAIESLSLQNWRTPFMIRTYGWTEAEIGSVMAPMLFASSIGGLFLGTRLTEWLGRKHKDAHVRATGYLYAFAGAAALAYPLMPTGEAALIMMSLCVMFGLAIAVPQNAAIQRITPNEMRGQVTAIYIFIFTISGALGSLFIALVTKYIVGDEARLWEALAISALLLLPLAIYAIVCGLKPYANEVKRLEALDR